MITELLEKIQYFLNEVGETEELNLLLDPTRSTLMYKHIKSKLPNLPRRYAIKVKEEYFPRLFNSYTEAVHFGTTMKENDMINEYEKTFLHFSKFELFAIEEI